MSITEKSQEQLGSHSSGPHQLKLEDHIRDISVDEVSKAREAFRAEQVSLPDVAEFREASGTMRDAVDEICEALLIVFGRISDVTDMVQGLILLYKNLLRWMVVTFVLQLLVCIVVVYLTVRFSTSMVAIEQTRANQELAIKDLRILTDKFSKLQIATESTKKVVDEVNRKAEAAPKVAIVPDGRKPGGAVVRIISANSAAASKPAKVVDIPIK